MAFPALDSSELRTESTHVLRTNDPIDETQVIICVKQDKATSLASSYILLIIRYSPCSVEGICRKVHVNQHVYVALRAARCNLRVQRTIIKVWFSCLCCHSIVEVRTARRFEKQFKQFEVRRRWRRQRPLLGTYLTLQDRKETFVRLLFGCGPR